MAAAATAAAVAKFSTTTYHNGSDSNLPSFSDYIFMSACYLFAVYI